VNARAWAWIVLGLALWGGGAAVTFHKPRGIRNNNPGNLRRTADRWDGLAPDQRDPDFFTFSDMRYGLRALGVLLLNYQRRHGLNTVHKIVARFAPSHENPTDAYIANVARALNVGPNEPIDVAKRLPELMRAIVIQENGAAPAAIHVTPSMYGDALMLIAQRET
jgi:hypothetical protein